MLLEEKLENGLVLRNVRDEGDIARFADFNRIFNNSIEGATCDCLLRHHPETTHQDYWMIEEVKTGRIVSTICLIPWTCNFDQLKLRTAMLEMVLSHPEYRRQGLVRTLIKHCIREVRNRNYDLSIIWGIPYYYRQYGFSYAIEGNTVETLPVWHIPDPASIPLIPYRLRPAILGDISCLTDFYRRSLAPLQVSIERSARYWKYLIIDTKYPVQMLEDSRSGEPIGYCVIKRSENGKAICILEEGLPSAMIGLSLLQNLKVDAEAKVLISWPENNVLATIARGLSSHKYSESQWLFHIPDMVRFLNKIAPVLEARLATSMWHGLTADLVINFFREAYLLGFTNGGLAKTESLGFVDASMGADGGHLCIPLDAFVRLVFGYRNLDELQDAWPDIVIKNEIRSLIDVLFPRLKAYLYTPFHYMESE